MKKLTIALAVAAAPALALACPACARDGGSHVAVLIGAMIAAPYAVTFAVLRAIRGGLR